MRNPFPFFQHMHSYRMRERERERNKPTKEKKRSCSDSFVLSRLNHCRQFEKREKNSKYTRNFSKIPIFDSLISICSSSSFGTYHQCRTVVRTAVVFTMGSPCAFTGKYLTNETRTIVTRSSIDSYLRAFLNIAGEMSGQKSITVGRYTVFILKCGDRITDAFTDHRLTT